MTYRLSPTCMSLDGRNLPRYVTLCCCEATRPSRLLAEGRLTRRHTTNRVNGLTQISSLFSSRMVSEPWPCCQCPEADIVDQVFLTLYREVSFWTREESKALTCSSTSDTYMPNYNLPSTTDSNPTKTSVNSSTTSSVCPSPLRMKYPLMARLRRASPPRPPNPVVMGYAR